MRIDKLRRFYRIGLSIWFRSRGFGLLHRKALFTVVAFGVAVLLVEISAGLLVALGGLGFQFSYVDQYKGLKEDVYKLPLAEFMLPHPYFGFHTNGLMFGGVNNYGFSSNVDYPFHNTKEDFTIGLFGGSVAEEQARFMASDNQWRERVKKEIPCLRDKSLVLLNFSLPAGKQPQQFLIFSFFASSLDLAINLDGLNEVSATMYPSFPLEYPFLPSFWFGLQTSGNTLLIRQEFRSWRDQLSEWGLRFPFNLSQSFFILWKALDRRIEALNKELSENFVVQYMPDRPQFSDIEYPKEELYPKMVDVWKRFTWQQYKLAESLGVQTLFLIQPSPYLIGTKSMTEDEKKIFKVSRHGMDDPQFGAKYRFGLLRAAMLDFKKQGLSFYDLRDVFKETKMSVYRDNCCHLHDYGKKILSLEIADRIIEKYKTSSQNTLKQLCQVSEG